MTSPTPAKSTTTTSTTAERAEATTDGPPARVWLSARVRILLWLLAVMALALVTVVLATRSILLREVDARIDRVLAQETSEFARFAQHGHNPESGARFDTPRPLLLAYLERQYPDPDEELLGYLDGAGRPRVIRQQRDIPAVLPLFRDAASLAAIAASPFGTGTLNRPQGEIRWAKVLISTESPARSSTEPSTTGARGTANESATSMLVVAYHTDGDQAGARAVVRVLGVISGLALLLSCVVGWAVAGSILAPVRLVRTAAAQLTEQDLTRRIPVRGRDDIAALAETFNGMLDRLERAFAAQRRFLDDAGHELRTPITIVRGHLELLGSGAGGPGGATEREETLRLVTDELDRMSRLVEDLLLLARAERPDFVQPAPVELAELTADVFVKARALGDRRWELPEVAEGETRLDAQRVTQAMVQLAQNAVQHTLAGQAVRIGSRRTPGRVELYVADEGPGVPADEARLIFERFRRGASRRGSRGSGAGLGLSIVRAIAEGHGGRVELRETPGGGATFVLVLEAR